MVLYYIFGNCEIFDPIPDIIKSCEISALDGITMTELLEYKGYRARIEYDSADGIFFGTVIDIRDSIGFHAASADDLQLAFQNAMEDYFEMCRQR